MIECIIDFETASATDLKKAGAHRYSECPTTEIISVKWQAAGGPVGLWHPGVPVDPALLRLANNSSVLFVSHGDFDKAIWRNQMVPLGWPDVPNNRWDSTQAACAYYVIPKDLEGALDVLDLPHKKDKEGNALTLSLSRPNRKGMLPVRTPKLMERIYAYNESDIVGTVALRARVGALPPSERNVWLLDQRINERGVKFDLPLVRAAQEVIDRATVPLLAEFHKLTSGLATTQVAKVKAWCEGQGTWLPNLSKETLTALLGSSIDGDVDEDESLAGDDAGGVWTSGDILPEVRRALSIRQLIGSASVKKLARIEQCVCADGRTRGLLQYHGTGPGLWAGRLVQPQNFPRPILQIKPADKVVAPSPDHVVSAIMSRDPDWVELILGQQWAPDGTPKRSLGAVECVVSALRNTIIPEADRQLAVGDFSGIQARLTYALAGQYDKVELMATGKSGAIYLDMGRQIYGYEITKEDITEYTIGKSSVLGLGFQMGARKFHARYCRDQPFAFAEKVVGIFRTQFAPEVPKLWRGLGRAAVRAVWDKKPQEFRGIEYRLENGWLSCRLPSGRKMRYFNPQPIREAMPWDEDDVRQAWTYETMKQGQWKTIKAFGGLLTENCAMGMQRDLLTRAMFTCEREGLPAVLNVHDELVTEPRITLANADKLLAEIMCDVPEWAAQMKVPVAVETWAGDRYRK